MKVELIDKMGSDLSVVNAARVSYSKESDWESITPAGPTPGMLSDRDEKLIKYLATHNHWSPFAHASLQFRIKAPVFVARQLVKHQVGLVWNEISRRYVDYEPEFFQPTEWRGRPENSKQGSDGVVHTDEEYYSRYVNGCKVYYSLLLNQGVAPEQARMVLPQSMMTEWIWSGTVYAFARVCNLRCKSDTQKETRDVANEISKLASEAFPHCWQYLIDK